MAIPLHKITHHKRLTPVMTDAKAALLSGVPPYLKEALVGHDISLRIEVWISEHLSESGPAFLTRNEADQVVLTRFRVRGQTKTVHFSQTEPFNRRLEVFIIEEEDLVVGRFEAAEFLIFAPLRLPKGGLFLNKTSPHRKPGGGVP